MLSGLILLAGVTLSQAGGTPESWRPYSSPRANYTVSFPSKPTEKKQPLALPDRTRIDLTVVSVRRGVGVYSVATSERPTPDIPSVALFNAARDDLTRQFKATVGGETAIDLDGHPGREIRLEVPKSVVAGGASGRARIYLVDRRLYEIVAIRPNVESAAGKAGAGVEPFLASFKLIEKVPVPPPAIAQSAEPKAMKGPATGASASPLAGWRPADTGRWGFTCLLPANVAASTQEQTTPLGPVKAHLLRASQGEGIYLVNVTELERKLAPAQFEDLIAGFQSGVVGKGGKLVGSRRLDQGGLRGLEVTAEPGSPAPAGLISKTRALFSENRIIAVTYAMPRSSGDLATGEAYLDSMKVSGGDARRGPPPAAR